MGEVEEFDRLSRRRVRGVELGGQAARGGRVCLRSISVGNVLHGVTVGSGDFERRSSDAAFAAGRRAGAAAVPSVIEVVPPVKPVAWKLAESPLGVSTIRLQTAGGEEFLTCWRGIGQSG